MFEIDMHRVAWEAYNELMDINSQRAFGFSANHYLWRDLFMECGWDAANALIKFYDDGVFSWGKSEITKNLAKSGSAGGANNGVSSGKPSTSVGGEAKFSHSTALGNPKSWSDKEYSAFIEKANADLTSLQGRNPNKEVGYFLRYNEEDNTLYADYFIGKDGETWLAPSQNPYGRKLGASEMILGFTHTHPTGPDYLSSEDGYVIEKMSLGEYKWTNIPHHSNNQNIKIINHLFFGMIYKNEFNSVRFHIPSVDYLPYVYGQIKNIYLNVGTLPNFNKKNIIFKNIKKQGN